MKSFKTIKNYKNLYLRSKNVGLFVGPVEPLPRPLRSLQLAPELLTGFGGGRREGDK